MTETYGLSRSGAARRPTPARGEDYVRTAGRIEIERPFYEQFEKLTGYL
jgi:hypothetical protein